MKQNARTAFLLAWVLARFFLVEVGDARAAQPCAEATIPLPNGQWNRHRCGAGLGHCADSDVPTPAPGGVTSISALANPMAACCGLGWGESSSPSGLKLDCVQAYMPQNTAVFDSFRAFYLAEPTADRITNAFVAYPNQMFVLDSSGVPVNGFYDQDGRRCNFRDATTKANINLKVADQMAIYTDSVTNLRLPTGAIANAEVDPYCCSMVVLALERLCPTNDTLGGIPVATTVGTTRRCTAAKQMKLDYGIFDLCDPTLVKRTRFRVATSYAGEDPRNATVTVNEPINVQSLIAQFYPPAVPGATPVCPVTPAVYTRPWTAGQCRLDPAEAFP